MKQAPTGARAPGDERTLIEQAQAADREAFEKLVARHDQKILGMVLHILGDRDEARDAYQEIFLKAYRSINRFRFESSFYTWIYRIAKNVCFDHLRKRESLRREVSMERDSEDHLIGLAPIETLATTACDSNPERSLYSCQIGEKIQEALKKLSKRERLVFELKHYHGLRMKAVGDIAGMTEATAKNYLYRGTQKLRAELSDLRTAGAVC